VTADLSRAVVQQIGPDQVHISGLGGKPRPDKLKVNICYNGGWLAEAEISYAGLQAEARARQAAQIVHERIGKALHLRIDLIGVLSLFGDDGGRMLTALPPSNARDVRLRIAATHHDRAIAERVLREVTALY